MAGRLRGRRDGHGGNGRERATTLRPFFVPEDERGRKEKGAEGARGRERERCGWMNDQWMNEIWMNSDENRWAG